MAKHSILSRERVIYWPEEYAEVVDLLTGKDREGRSISNAPYSFNTGAIILAASVGLRASRKRDVGSRRKEISTQIFLNHDLESYLMLIPILANPDAATDLLRPENEETTLKEFERYAAGGLEVIAGELESSAGREIELVLQALLSQPDDGNSQSEEVPNLLE